MAVSIPRELAGQTSTGYLRKALGILQAVRRYPLIPSAIVLIVMVIPAIFAPLIAPHPPTRGILTERLAPPFWIQVTITTQVVVSEIDPVDYRPQVLVGDAQLLIDRGDARILSGGNVASPGDELVNLIKVVEEVDPNDPADQVSLERAQDRIDRHKMRAVSSDEVAVGSRLEEIAERGGTTEYLLGTDKVGRDILSRIIYGSRISIVVAGVAIFIGGFIGTALGISAGYFGSWTDALVMRLVDISLSIPIILLALVLVAALGASFTTVIAVLVVLLWAHYARMARGVTLSVRVQDYIDRARVAGASDTRIMVRHVFPNVFNSLVVLATLQIGFVIVVESTLSFLGAGIPRPTPAWGLMVADGRELIVSHWWVAFFPGLAILLVVLAMNLLGDWLRDRLDPKQRQV